jgi:heme/copper-type cytochrome/quinol oxidase subunit 2
LAYQPTANSTFLSEQTSHQQPVFFSQNNQHQPSATSQTKRLVWFLWMTCGIVIPIKFVLVILMKCIFLICDSCDFDCNF